MQCELCGLDTELFEAEIEGAVLNICQKCARYGKVRKKVVSISKNENSPKILRSKVIEEKQEIVQSLVEGYAGIIRNAREKLGLKQEEFAARINEKLSVIRHIEQSRLEPSIALAKKLEKILSVKLVEEHGEERSAISQAKDESLTIGDLIKGIKRR